MSKKPAKRTTSRADAKRPSKAVVSKRVGGRAGSLGKADGDALVRAYIASLPRGSGRLRKPSTPSRPKKCRVYSARSNGACPSTE